MTSRAVNCFGVAEISAVLDKTQDNNKTEDDNDKNEDKTPSKVKRVSADKIQDLCLEAEEHGLLRTTTCLFVSLCLST